MTPFSRPHVSGSPRRQQALRVLAAALAAVEPGAALRAAVRREGEALIVGARRYDLGAYRRVLVVGGGKAGAPMAAALEGVLGDRITAGVINVKTGYSGPTERIAVREAGHPVPDAAGVAGARAMRDLLRGATAEDLVICLISGGGSALMTLPVEGVSLDEMQALTGELLRSGAPIQAINAVRKHLEQLKGGRLAQIAQPATVIALILSDVVGSPLDVIASGPTAPDPTTYADAWGAIERYGLADRLPPGIARALRGGLAGEMPDTPKPGDAALARVQNVILADNARAAQAARAEAARLGFHTLLLSTFVEGEAREVGRVVAALAKEVARSDQPAPRPACLLLGGETTVIVRGAGKGGRNQELALAAALAIQGEADALIASLATDGTDGPTDAAGGLVDGATVARGAALGLSAQTALDANDAYPYLDAVGDLLVTGPTNTNVNDLIAVFVFE